MLTIIRQSVTDYITQPQQVPSCGDGAGGNSEDAQASGRWQEPSTDPPLPVELVTKSLLPGQAATSQASLGLANLDCHRAHRRGDDSKQRAAVGPPGQLQQDCLNALCDRLGGSSDDTTLHLLALLPSTGRIPKVADQSQRCEDCISSSLANHQEAQAGNSTAP